MIVESKIGFNSDLFVDKIITYFSEDYGEFISYWIKKYLIDVGIIHPLNARDSTLQSMINTLRLRSCARDRLALIIPSVLFRDLNLNIQLLFLAQENYSFIVQNIPQFKCYVPDNTNVKYQHVKNIIYNNRNIVIGNQRDFMNNNSICNKYVKINTVIQLSLSSIE